MAPYDGNGGGGIVWPEYDGDGYWLAAFLDALHYVNTKAKCQV